MSKTNHNPHNHWETYYQDGNLVSCPMGSDKSYSAELRETWINFFSSLPNQSTIVDIGTGNGAIPILAIESTHNTQKNLEIHGVDIAQINPKLHVENGKELFSRITFHPGTGAEKMPFPNSSVNAVSGQFSLEYTNIESSLKEIYRVTRNDAKGLFVLHHKDSIVSRNAKKSLTYARLIFDGMRIFDKLRNFVDHERNNKRSANNKKLELETFSRIIFGKISKSDNPIFYRHLCKHWQLFMSSVSSSQLISGNLLLHRLSQI